MEIKVEILVRKLIDQIDWDQSSNNALMNGQGGFRTSFEGKTISVGGFKFGTTLDMWRRVAEEIDRQIKPSGRSAELVMSPKGWMIGIYQEIPDEEMKIKGELSLGETETEDPHAGEFYNPITGRWSFL